MSVCVCEKLPKVRLFFASENSPYYCSGSDKYIFVKSPVLGFLSVILGMLLIFGGVVSFVIYKMIGVVVFVLFFLALLALIRFGEVMFLQPIQITRVEKRDAENKKNIMLLTVFLVVFLLILGFEFFG